MLGRIGCGFGIGNRIYKGFANMQLQADPAQKPHSSFTPAQEPEKTPTPESSPSEISESDLRKYVVEIVAKGKGQSAEVVSLLLNELARPGEVPVITAYALSRCDSKMVVPRLLTYLGPEYPLRTRELAALALSGHGPEAIAAGAVPTLVQIMNDPQAPSDLRFSAAFSLTVLATREDCREKLERDQVDIFTFYSEGKVPKDQIRQTLKYKSVASVMVPFLVQKVDEMPTNEAKSFYVFGLGFTGRIAVDAKIVPLLTNYLSSKDPLLRFAAASALHDLAQGTKEDGRLRDALPALDHAIQKTDGEMAKMAKLKIEKFPRVINVVISFGKSAPVAEPVDEKKQIELTKAHQVALSDIFSTILPARFKPNKAPQGRMLFLEFRFRGVNEKLDPVSTYWAMVGDGKLTIYDKRQSLPSNLKPTLVLEIGADYFKEVAKEITPAVPDAKFWENVEALEGNLFDLQDFFNCLE